MNNTLGVLVSNAELHPTVQAHIVASMPELHGDLVRNPSITTASLEALIAGLPAMRQPGVLTNTILCTPSRARDAISDNAAHALLVQFDQVHTISSADAQLDHAITLLYRRDFLVRSILGSDGCTFSMLAAASQPGVSFADHGLADRMRVTSRHGDLRSVTGYASRNATIVAGVSRRDAKAQGAWWRDRTSNDPREPQPGELSPVIGRTLHSRRAISATIKHLESWAAAGTVASLPIVDLLSNPRLRWHQRRKLTVLLPKIRDGYRPLLDGHPDCIPHGGAKVLVEALSDDPAEWIVVISMLEHYVGNLHDLVAAARRSLT